MKHEYKVTKELMMSWAKEYRLYNARNKFLFGLLCFLACLALCGILLCIFARLDWYMTVLYALTLGIAIYKLFFERFVVQSKRYKLFSRMYGVSEWMRSHEFTEDGILYTDHTSVTTLKYENITKIKEYRNDVLILFRDNIVIRLYYDAFTEGSWEACKALLKTKQPGL